ncbi:MAG TPA: DUF4440 domain-containing protein [Sandaracinaceae bacterium LLY-WYZ-13_1]|nr:DUF4440 domain-containing protein [Sandaracinaceae bacterium LLY-WYZ-13_1]
MNERCEREVRGLHVFFERWFRGELGDGDFARVADALASDFELVSPRGVRDGRASILAGVRSARGRRGPDFTIAIEDLVVRWQGEDACLVRYEEHQRDGDGATARISSAWFRRRDDAPCGVEWVHLHETWLPSGRR